MYDGVLGVCRKILLFCFCDAVIHSKFAKNLFYEIFNTIHILVVVGLENQLLVCVTHILCCCCL